MHAGRAVERAFVGLRRRRLQFAQPGGSEVPRVANVGVGAKSLDELCQTASAKRYATRADELISQGDLSGAKRELMLALREDGENPALAERLDALDLALFAMGA